MSTLELTALIGIVLGGLSLLIFTLAHAALVSPVYMGGAVAVALLCLFLILRRFLRTCSSGDGSFDMPRGEGRLSLVECFILLLSAIFVLLILPFDLAPPLARDELIQHLTLPVLYLREGSAVKVPFMGVSYFPMNMNMLYLAGMSFGSEALPRLTHHAFGLLTAFGIYSYLRFRTPRRYAMLGALLFIATPVVLNLSRVAYVDLGATFYSTLALFALLRWRHSVRSANSGRKWFYYSAVLLGFSLGTKYNMLIALMLLSSMVVYISLKREDAPARNNGQGAAIRDGVIYAAIALLVFSPWLVRNFIWAGSPLYPLFGAIVDGTGVGAGLHTGGSVSPIEKRYLLYGENLMDILMVPLRIFWEGVDGSIRKFDGVLNPVYLLFIALAFVRRLGRDQRYLWYLMGFAGAFFTMTFFTTDLVIRYILPVLPPVVIIAVAGIRGSIERAGLSRYVVFAGLLCFFLFSGVYLYGLHARYAPIGYLAGAESRGEYLSSRLPDYETTAYANANIPQDSKVLMLFTGERTYYWEREYYYGGRLGENIIAQVGAAAGSEELLRDMRGDGFTHLFIMDHIFERFAADNFNETELGLLRDFFGRYVKRIYSANGFSLYRLAPLEKPSEIIIN